MLDRRWAAALPAAGMVVAVLASLARFAGPPDGLAGVLVMVGVPVLLVAGVIAGWAYSHAREKAVQAFAAQIGWTYVGEHPFLAEGWRAPFGTGSNRRVSEYISGSYSGRTASSFVYRYTTRHGDKRETHVFHVVRMALPTWLPGLQLSPEHLGTRLVAAFGGQDLQFESEDFNRAWRVEARDPKYAHDVLHPRTLERLTRPDARGFTLRIEGSELLSWSLGATDFDTLAARLAVMDALIDGVPRFVWLDNGYDPVDGTLSEPVPPPLGPDGIPLPSLGMPAFGADGPLSLFPTPGTVPPVPRYDPQQSSKENPTWTP